MTKRKMAPDWTTAPPWAHYWAVDASGLASWYQDKPYVRKDLGAWHPNWLSEFQPDNTVCSKWTKSLHKRPETDPAMTVQESANAIEQLAYAIRGTRTALNKLNQALQNDTLDIYQYADQIEQAYKNLKHSTDLDEA